MFVVVHILHHFILLMLGLQEVSEILPVQLVHEIVVLWFYRWVIQSKVLPRIKLKFSVEEPKVVDLSEHFHVIRHKVHDICLFARSHWYVVDVDFQLIFFRLFSFFRLFGFWTVLWVLIISCCGQILGVLECNSTFLTIVFWIKLIEKFNIEFGYARFARFVLWFLWSIGLVLFLLAVHVVLIVHCLTEIVSYLSFCV